MNNWPGYFTRIFLTTARFAASGWISCVGARHGSLRGRNSRLPQDRRSGLARASAARRARRAAHRMCAVQFALISTICPSFSLNMTGTSKQELKMHAQAEPERPKGEGSSWSGAAPRLRGGRPSLRGGRPEAKHCFAKRERADTDVGPGGCKWIIIAAGRQRQQRSEVAGATLQMARVLFASNEGQMVERYRIFAFTTFYRADSMASVRWATRGVAGYGRGMASPLRYPFRKLLNYPGRRLWTRAS